jgi:hypothetical protein
MLIKKSKISTNSMKPINNMIKPSSNNKKNINFLNKISLE